MLTPNWYITFYEPFFCILVIIMKRVGCLKNRTAFRNKDTSPPIQVEKYA